jgi:hypothetical protein
MKWVKSRRIQIAGRVAGLEEARNMYRVLVREISSRVVTG